MCGWWSKPWAVSTGCSPRGSLAIAFLLSVTAPAVAQQDELFDSNGTKIRYVSEGTGEAIVLIHGWMSDSSFSGRR
jgi:hypothetical protein